MKVEVMNESLSAQKSNKRVRLRGTMNAMLQMNQTSMDRIYELFMYESRCGKESRQYDLFVMRFQSNLDQIIMNKLQCPTGCMYVCTTDLSLTWEQNK